MVPDQLKIVPTFQKVLFLYPLTFAGGDSQVCRAWDMHTGYLNRLFKAIENKIDFSLHTNELVEKCHTLQTNKAVY